MRTRALFAVASLAVAVLALGLGPSPAAAYHGVLLSADAGIAGTGNWIVPGPTSLEWWVTQNTDSSWHYRYLFAHPAGATSHFILEVSESFDTGDIFNASGHFGAWSLGTFSPQAGNPNMPGPMYGIKFDQAWGTSTSLEFDSSRAPMWGDFYSKNGAVSQYKPPTFNTAWNAGFLAADPTGPAGDGAYMAHLLVPDTKETPPVPEPSTLLLLGSGLVGIAAAARRRRL